MREWRAEVRERLSSARLDGATERDVIDELSQHLEDRYAELRARGVPEDEARAQALAELDREGVLAERLRRTLPPRPEPMAIGRAGNEELMVGLWNDLRVAVRMLARSPLYATIAVLLIGLGIGANTVMFTALNTVLLRPPSGVADPERLAAVFTSDYSGPRFGSSSYPDFVAIRDDLGVFEGVAAHTAQTMGVVGDGWSWRGMVEVVSADYFGVLGVSPGAGRFFAADENGPGRPTSVAVISDDLWQARYGRAPSALGSTLRIKGEPFTVIGVAPPDFGGTFRPLRVQLWLPMSAPSAVTGVDASQRGNRGLAVIGRLTDGVDVETVQSRLDVVAARLHSAYPDQWTDVNERSRVFTALPEAEVRVPRQARGAVLGVMGLLMGAVFTVLLIACTNVANLTLSRASTRRAEMGIRLALGATRARIVRQLLAESFVLAVLGGAGGLLLATSTVAVLRLRALPLELPLELDVTIDARVLAFTALVTLLTGFLFGLAPALQGSRRLAPTMKEGGGAGERLRVRHALVVFQIASSVVLLVAGGVFVRSLRAARSMDSGFQVDPVMVARFDLGPEGYADEEGAAFNAELLGRAAGLPGATAVALAENLPLGTGWSRSSLSVEGYEPAAGEDMQVMTNRVTPGFFAAMGVGPRLGRTFTDADTEDAPPVVMVTEAFARRFWPGESPIGKHVGLGEEGPPAEVVGMLSDGKYRSLAEDPEPYVYFPYFQRPSGYTALVVRSAADPAVVADAVRSLVRDLDPALPPPTVQSYREHMSTAVVPQRIAAGLLSSLGLIAIAIAAIGLYGLVAFGVTRRAREFGIRIALGAGAGDIRRLVLWGALRLALIGIACGVPVAAAVAILARGLLVVHPIDPAAFLLVPALLAGSAILASYGPARRATRQDPVVALKAE